MRPTGREDEQAVSGELLPPQSVEFFQSRVGFVFVVDHGPVEVGDEEEAWFLGEGAMERLVVVEVVVGSHHDEWRRRTIHDVFASRSSAKSTVFLSPCGCGDGRTRRRDQRKPPRLRGGEESQREERRN